MTTVEKKKPRCECPNSKSNRDVVVITIETCCRRPCDESDIDDKSHHSREEKKEPKSVHSTPEIKPTQHPQSRHESIHDPSAVKISDEDERSKESEPDTELEPEIEPEPETESEPEKPRKEESETDRSEPALQHQRTPLKLPLLVERHHGPGCAMEISVLEKHEKSCMYKKEEDDRRNLEDRVGSYECIGRLVFRTCNASELESDSSGMTGPTTSVSSSPTKISKTTPAIKPQPQSLPPSSSAPEHVSREPSSIGSPHREPSTVSTSSAYKPAKSLSSASPQKSSLSTHHSIKSDRTHQSVKSDHTHHSIKSDHTHPSVKSDHTHPSVKSDHSNFEQARSEIGSEQGSVQEDTIVSEKHEPVEASRRRRSPTRRDPQVFMAASRTFPDVNIFQRPVRDDDRKHYPGDDCKLHSPRGPLIIPGGQFDKIYSSKKTFRVSADEGNQTDAGDNISGKSKISLIETISSLTDLSKTAEKRKSSFFGSLFRKTSTKSSNLSDSKKFKK